MMVAAIRSDAGASVRAQIGLTISGDEAQKIEDVRWELRLESRAAVAHQALRYVLAGLDSGDIQPADVVNATWPPPATRQGVRGKR